MIVLFYMVVSIVIGAGVWYFINFISEDTLPLEIKMFHAWWDKNNKNKGNTTK